MSKEIELKNRQIRLKGPLGPERMQLLRADIVEGLGEITKADIQFLSAHEDTPIEDVVGQRLNLEVDLEDGSARVWSGICVSCAYEGRYAGQSLFRAEMRSLVWMLTLRKDCRIFQEKSPLEVIKDVFKEVGISDVRDATRETYDPRDYIVQYRESDFDFISRIMQEEGIYYFFEHESGKDTIVLADDISAHKPLPNTPTAGFIFPESEFKRDQDHVFDWKSHERITTGKVTLTDYCFETSATNLKETVPMPKGKHSHKDIEIYDSPGIYAVNDDGKTRAKIRAQALAAENQRTVGKGNIRDMAAGFTFKLEDHPRDANNGEYLILTCHHKLQIETDVEDEGQATSTLRDRQPAETETETKPAYEVEFTVQPKSEPYRSGPATPRPAIAGLQTAVVTGPDGEEIYTDEFGRIKVQFHWDRLGEKDDKTTCFIRVMQPVSGQDWGMFHIPRIGQEVVVQFEEGNPDRPIVMGMLYNDAKKPPYDFPDNKTQTGIKTRSTPESEGFHELVFEDKAGEEFVRFHSQKDLFSKVRNNTEVYYGSAEGEDKTEGDYTETVYRNKTIELKTGDHSFTVTEGKEVISIATTREVTVGEDETITIENDKTDSIGNDYTATVGTNYSITVGDTLTIEADTEIVLKVGDSEISITSSEIHIKSTNVSIEADSDLTASGGSGVEITSDGSLDLTGGATTLEGSDSLDVTSSGITTVEGSAVMIN